ncbi:MAG: ral secretion pathway protein GspM [Rhodoferax sp.]|nr:ral secretion pathway protein GspM [Rhodoferax sp.]
MKLPASLQLQWDRLAPRERRSVAAALALVAIALLWWVALAPALRTLRGAEAQHQLLDAQLQTMHRLQAEAQALQAQPKLGFEEALRALEASVRQRFGTTAQLSVVGDRATVTLKGASADALAQWLAQARINARALPAEARLQRSPGAVPATGPTWDGTLVMSLPAR